MAGDPCQLPSTVSLGGKKLNHHVSLMERLMKLNVETTKLDTQRRMHPLIVSFPNKEFYNGQLKTIYCRDTPDNKPFSIIDVKGSEEKEGTSFYNHKEATEAISQYHHHKHNYDSVVIIVPYRAQQKYLWGLDGSLHIHTVDSFQGQEADVVIITTVRTTTMGFWNDRRRLNVALTRARHVLRVIGDVGAWQRDDDCVLYKLVDHHS